MNNPNLSPFQPLYARHSLSDDNQVRHADQLARSSSASGDMFSIQKRRGSTIQPVGSVGVTEVKNIVEHANPNELPYLQYTFGPRHSGRLEHLQMYIYRDSTN